MVSGIPVQMCCVTVGEATFNEDDGTILIVMKPKEYTRDILAQMSDAAVGSALSIVPTAFRPFSIDCDHTKPPSGFVEKEKVSAGMDPATTLVRTPNWYEE